MQTRISKYGILVIRNGKKRYGSQHSDEYVKVKTSIGTVMVKVKCRLGGGYNQCTSPDIYSIGKKQNLRDLTEKDEKVIEITRRNYY